MADPEREAELDREAVKALTHIFRAYDVTGSSDPKMCYVHVGQPNHLDPDGFKLLFKERLSQGEITLDEECSIQCDDPTKRLWLVSYPVGKEEDFLKFLDEYGNLHGFSYRQGTLKYPR